MCMINTRMGKLLAVDLDGTLFYPKQHTKCISKKNVKFLQKWIDQGNKVVLISSRGYDFVKRLKEEIQRDFDFMSNTSAQIEADGKLLRDIYMPIEQLTDILSDIEKKYQPTAILASGKEPTYYIKTCHPIGKFLAFFYKLWWVFQWKYREPTVIDNQKYEEFMQKGNVCKVMIFYGIRKNKAKISKEINKDLRNQYTDIEFSWTAQVNELTPMGCSKSEGLEQYCSLMNIDKSDVYVVGDSGNDISMFQKFYEHSYCMKHSYPAVKKYAANVISRVYKLDKLVLKGDKQHETN